MVGIQAMPQQAEWFSRSGVIQAQIGSQVTEAIQLLMKYLLEQLANILNN